MKKLILLLLLIPTLCFAEGVGVTTWDTNCDQAKYQKFGVVCQDTDDGKAYKWSGAAMEEIGTGSGGGVVEQADCASPLVATDAICRDTDDNKKYVRDVAGTGIVEVFTGDNADGSGDCGSGAVCLGDHTHSQYTTSGYAELVFTIDGAGAVISTGEKGFLEIPFACTITGWTIMGDQSGSIVVDVWKDTYANFPPTVADTIAGSEKPTLSSTQKGQDLSLGTWTTAVTAGDILLFNVDSAATVRRATIVIRVTL